MRVSNNKCIHNLSSKSMRAAKSRNLIAIIAIALTTILFTTLFTIVLSINHSFQQSNFRQVGTYAHGGFKYVTEEQIAILSTDPLVKDYGLRRLVGMPMEAPFNKTQVEISYTDATEAKWMYATPQTGKLPKEGTNEAAVDSKILELLGIEPEIGAEFTISFDVDSEKTTETFVLSGWWEHDEAAKASHVLIPNSYVQSILDKLGTKGTDGITGTWTMNIMLSNSFNIGEKLETILANHGFQSENKGESDYIAIGVNWGYTGSQIVDSFDIETVLMVVVLLLVIIFTGYLIIYNVFLISVASDIRYYGLLKTIGTTGRQIKRMIRMQAFRLSIIGIPIGLLLGYGLGLILVPIVFARLNGLNINDVTANPLIFIISAFFSLITVFISCRKPGNTAAKVSPIEAIKYTDTDNNKCSTRKSTHGTSLPRMALANLGRNKKKTIITVISLSLAVVLLNITVTFTNGFDMDKYLADMVADYIVADAGYFNVGTFWDKDMALSEDAIEQINEQEGITNSGRVYGLTIPTQALVTEENFRSSWGQWNSEETVNSLVETEERSPEGLFSLQTQLYGMDEYALSKLRLHEGDLSKLNDPEGRYVAAVYHEDDYGNRVTNSNWTKVGDRFTIRYVEEVEYYSYETDEIIETISDDVGYYTRAKKYRDVEVEVAAAVSVPAAISYRYYGSDEFVMGDKAFIEDTGTSDIMMYAFDTIDEAKANMETFLQDFTQNVQPQLGFESKQTYAEEFYAFRDMFMLLGGVLSAVIGLVGVLNFLNAILTGIITRRREFAMLQAVGMTGKQLKGMLIWEGLYYTLGASVLSLVFCAITVPLLRSVLGNMFWFFSYKFTIIPVLIVTPIFAVLGIVLPLIVYKKVARYSIVERLREIV